MAETKKTLVGCIRELEKVIAEHREKYDAKEAREDYWISEYTKQTQAPGLKSYELQEIKDRLKATQDQKAEELEGIRKSYSEKAAKIREEFEALLSEKYDPSPDSVDGAAMSLLNSGILSPREIHKMAASFSDNPTMLRLIAKHAEEKMIGVDRNTQRDDYLALVSVVRDANNAKNAVGNALETFDGLGKIADRMLGIGRASGFDKSARDQFAPIFAGAINNAVYFLDPTAVSAGDEAKETT